jgi:hypothetical protein
VSVPEALVAERFGHAIARAPGRRGRGSRRISAKGRRKLAGDMLRAPLALEKMTYDAATGTVIKRSKMHPG